MTAGKSRAVLVTGASRGIGRAVALALAEAGADVAVNYHEKLTDAQAVVAAVQKAGRRAVAVGADVADSGAVGTMMHAVTAQLGPVDVLVSNAGLSRVQPLEDVTAAPFNEMLAENLRAPFLLAQHTVPAMRERGSGRIRDADAGRGICGVRPLNPWTRSVAWRNAGR